LATSGNKTLGNFRQINFGRASAGSPQDAIATATTNGIEVKIEKSGRHGLDLGNHL
jgi:hypothetical protein